MSRRTLRISLLAGATLLLVLLIVSDAAPYLRGPAPGTSEWYWPYKLRPLADWWLAILAGLLFLSISVWWLARPQFTKLAITGLVLANLFLQIGLVYGERPAVMAELVDRTLANETSGYFRQAADVSTIGSFLQDFPETMPTFDSEHARTHPPGLILINWLGIQAFSKAPSIAETIARQIRPLRCTDLWLFEQPSNILAGLAAAAVLPMLLGALTTVPAFFLARRLLRPAATRLATMLAASLPALLIFTPSSVQIDVFLAVTIILALSLGIKKSGWWFFVAGLLYSLATFLNLGNAVLILPLAALVAGNYISIHQLPDFSLVRRLLAFAGGAASIWLIYWLAFGVQPWVVAQVGLQQHYELVTNHRRYDWWLIYNPLDLLLYAGLPIVAGFIGALLLAGRSWRDRSLRPVDGLVIGLGLLILIMNLSGSTRGEVGRLWLFLMPLMALPAAGFFNRTQPGNRAAVLLVGLQLLLSLSLGLAWRPIQAVIVVAQEPEIPSTIAQNSIDITFQDPRGQPGILHLTGYDLDDEQAVPGGFLESTLYWETGRGVQRPYTVFNHLVGDGGSQPVAQKDNWPASGQWPPTCWKVGEQVVDSYRIELPADLPPGQYTLQVGLYDASDGTRLLTEDGRDALQLTTVTIAPGS